MILENRFVCKIKTVAFHRLDKGPLREGPVTTSPRSRSMENVADAKLEKTSLSADVLQGVPFVTGPSLRYVVGRPFDLSSVMRYCDCVI